MKLEGNARQQDLVKARQSIQSVMQLYPDLGGEKWKAEFDELMKQIQTAESENAADSKDNPTKADAKS